MKALFLLTIVLSSSIVWADGSHRTKPTQSVRQFFSALQNWDRKLENGARLARPTISFNKEITLRSTFDANSNRYSRRTKDSEERVSQDCKVEISLSNSSAPTNTHVTFSRGMTRNFKQMTVRDNSRYYSDYAEIMFHANNFSLQVYVSNKCKPSEITRAMADFGVSTRFMSPQSDASCGPQFDNLVLSSLNPVPGNEQSDGTQDGLRSLDNEVEVNQSSENTNSSPAAIGV